MPKIPEPTILRLSAYRRSLEEFLEQSSQSFISSQELGRLSNRSADIVRKDLSYFGEYGIPGKGYDVARLQKHIAKILNVTSEHPVVLLGAGNLGKALLGYPGFKRQGFNFVGVFDSDPKKVGRKVAGIKIKSNRELAQTIKKFGAGIGVLTVPAAAAQEVTQLLITAGIRAIINFTPARIWVPQGIALRNVDLARELEVASYYLSRSSGKR